MSRRSPNRSATVALRRPQDCLYAARRTGRLYSLFGRLLRPFRRPYYQGDENASKKVVATAVISPATPITFIVPATPAAFADDVIVLRNGDVINGIVTEVSSDAIKYKMISNSNGPTYSTNREEVLSIKYSYGEIEKFDSSVSDSQLNPSEVEYVPVKASAVKDNSSELQRYAPPIKY